MKLQNNITKTIAFMAILASSCGDLFEPNDPIDCYELGRELTEEEKNIFPYQVGDSIVFTDGIKDYYIKCVDIIDTINTIREYLDIECIDETNKLDYYFRHFIFNTDIKLSENSNEFEIAVSPTSSHLIFSKYNGTITDNTSEKFIFTTERILVGLTDNKSYLDSLQLFIESILINHNLYSNVYKLSSINMNHNVEYSIISITNGILMFNLKENNEKIELK